MVDVSGGAQDDFIFTSAGTLIPLFDLLANDDGALDFLGIDTTGTKGTVTVLPGAPGRVRYDPNGQFDGLAPGTDAVDRFTYSVRDGGGNVTTATVEVEVHGALLRMPGGLLSLGGTIFADDDFDGLLNGGESGIGTAITVQLYSDDGGTAGSFDATDTLVATQTLQASDNGTYSFTGLKAGDYIVVLPETNFVEGGALEGRGDTPEGASDPDDDVDDDNNGLPLTSDGVVTRPVTLTVGSEPLMGATPAQVVFFEGFTDEIGAAGGQGGIANFGALSDFGIARGSVDLLDEVSFDLAYAASFASTLLKRFTPDLSSGSTSNGAEAGRQAAEEFLRRKERTEKPVEDAPETTVDDAPPPNPGE